MRTENFFKKRREELDITQRAIADQLGMVVAAVSRWECNLNAPAIKMADQLAVIYKVTPAKMREEIAGQAKRLFDARRTAVAAR